MDRALVGNFDQSLTLFRGQLAIDRELARDRKTIFTCRAVQLHVHVFERPTLPFGVDLQRHRGART